MLDYNNNIYCFNKEKTPLMIFSNSKRNVGQINLKEIYFISKFKNIDQNSRADFQNPKQKQFLMQILANCGRRLFVHEYCTK